MSVAWRLAAILVVASLLLPGALAGSVESLVIQGDTRASSTNDAVFAIIHEGGITWSASASQLLVERHFANYTRLDATRTSYYGPDQRTTSSLGAVTLQGLGTRDMGAMLVRSAGLPFGLEGLLPSGLVVQPQQDVSFAEFNPDEIDGGNQPSHYYIDEVVPGQFAGMTAQDADLEIRGTFTLILYDVDYALVTGQGTSAERTGRYAVTNVAGVVQGVDMQHRLTLVNGVLKLHVPTSVTMLATAAQLDLHGSVTLRGGDVAATPGLVLEQGGADNEARYVGAAKLDVSPARGQSLNVEAVRATTSGPLPLAEAGWSFLAVTAAIALLIALVAIVLTRRRARREDDAAAGITAMEERRFEDAILPLTRALIRRPHDAHLTLDLALCLEEVGRLEEAKRQYEAAVRLAPVNAEALYYYARLLARMRLHAESAAHLHEALVLDPRLEEMAAREAAFRGNLGVSR